MIRGIPVRFAALLFCLVILSPAVRPQAITDWKKSGELSKASLSFAAADGKHNARDQALESQKRTGQEWFNRGYELHSAERYREAIEAFKRSIELGYRPASAMYNVACGYALLNDRENALAWLERALTNGFDRKDLLADDSDLDPLRTDVRFRKVVAGVPDDPDRSAKNKTHKKLDRLEQANLDFVRLDREASEDGDQWHQAGLQLLRLRDYDRSIVALNRAVTWLGYQGNSAMYNLACAYALKGDPEAGINWLEKSVNAGFDNNSKLEDDPDLNSLRADSRFSKIADLSRTLSLNEFSESSDGSLYSKQRWAPAVERYESFVRRQPNNGRAWFDLGYALHFSREHARAVEAFEHAAKLGYREPASMYNIACAYAMLNQRDLAFEWLDKAVEAGYEQDCHILHDRDFDNLRSDPRFKRFVDAAKCGHKETEE